MHLIKRAVLACAMIALVAACGGSTPGATAAPTAPASLAPTSTAQQPVATAGPTSEQPGATNPPVNGTTETCSLLTPADLNAALGRDDYAAGEDDTVGGCSYNLEGVSGNQGDLVYVAFQTQTLDFIKSAFPEGGTDMTVGGRAAFYNPTEGLSSLWVDLGDGRLFVLSFSQANDLDPSYQAIAQQLAEIALGNL